MCDVAWNFVQVDGQAGKTKNAKNQATIRSAAMRAFRRKQRLERVKAYQTECAVQARAAEAADPRVNLLAAPCGSKDVWEPIGAFEREISCSDPSDDDAWSHSDAKTPLQSSSSELIRTTLSTETWLQSSDLEIRQTEAKYSPGYLSLSGPFLNTGLSSLAYLFNYFVSMIIPFLLPVTSPCGQKAVRNFWSSSLLNDPLLLHAAAFHAAVYIEAMNGRQTNNLAAMHGHCTRHLIKERINLAAIHGQYTMHLIRERLASNSSLIDDETIGAVALVASNLNITGNVRESQIHIDGLVKMMRLRSGKGSLSTTTQYLVSWLDISSARITRSKLRFSPANCITERIENSPQTISHKAEIFGLIEELRQLTSLWEVINTDPSTTIADILDFDGQRNHLEERMITDHYKFSSKPSPEFDDAFLETLLIATSIYTMLAFRNFRPNFPILQILKQDLIAAIIRAEASYTFSPTIPDSETPYAGFLIWVLFIGGLLAADAEERNWFADRIVFVVPWTEATCWRDVDRCLKRCLWVDKFDNEAFMALRRKVEGVMGWMTEEM